MRLNTREVRFKRISESKKNSENSTFFFFPFSGTGYGVQSVTTVGTSTRLMSCVNSWDTRTRSDKPATPTSDNQSKVNPRSHLM